MARETNYLVPENSQDILSMPNIEKEVKEEIEKLTLELIEEVKEMFNAGITYSTIEYIEDELQPVIPISRLLNEIRDKITRAIVSSLIYKKGVNYNYLDYVKLFTIDYDNNGKAKVKLNIPLNGINEEIKIKNLGKLI